MFRCNAPLPDVIRKIVIRKVDDTDSDMRFASLFSLF